MGSFMTASRISVCHVIAGHQWAGAEVQVATLVKTLCEHNSVTCSAIVFERGRLSNELSESGCEVKIIDQRKKTIWQLVAEASEFVRSRNVQILHSHRYKENLLAAYVARHCHVPCLVRTEHGPPKPCPGLKGMKGRCAFALDRIVGRLTADRHISVSHDLVGYLRRTFDPTKVVAITNGIDVQNVESALSAAAAKMRLQIANSAPVVGWVGRLESVKRPDLFLRAAEHVAKARPDVMFVMAGTGQEEAKLKERIKGSVLHDRIMFLGHREDAYDVLRAFDVLLIPSDQEGLPMVLLEAMALGVAVVARQVGGIPEAIQHNVSGLLVASDDPAVLGDSCLTLLHDAGLRNQLARCAREVVERKYSVVRTAAETLDLYHSLLSEKPC